MSWPKRCPVAGSISRTLSQDDHEDVTIVGDDWQHRWSEPIMWTRELLPTGPLWERTAAQAPEACAWHNVWFGEDFISDPKTQAEARRYAAAT